MFIRNLRLCKAFFVYFLFFSQESVICSRIQSYSDEARISNIFGQERKESSKGIALGSDATFATP